MRTPIEQKPDTAKNGILREMVFKWGPVRDYLPSKTRPRIADTLFPAAVKEAPQLPPVEERVEKWMGRLNEDYWHTGGYYERDGMVENMESIGRIRDAYVGVAREHFSQEALTDLQTYGIEYRSFDKTVLEQWRRNHHESIRLIDQNDELFNHEPLPMPEILALDDRQNELRKKEAALEQKLYREESKTDALFTPKEALLDRLNNQEKEVLAHVLNLSGLDYTITGKGVLADQEIIELQDRMKKEYWEKENREKEDLDYDYINYKMQKQHEIIYYARRQLNPPDIEDRFPVQKNLQKWQEIQERERKDPIPTPEEAGLDVEKLNAVRENLQKLQTQEWDPAPTTEEIRHLVSLPDAQDPQDRPEVKANLAAWKEKTRRRGQVDDEEDIA